MARLKKQVPSVTVSLRIEAKNKYLAEVAARRAGVSLNRLMEMALEDAVLKDSGGTYRDEVLWNENPFTRFALIAESHPELLSIEDEFRWKAIQSDRSLFRGKKLDWKAVEAAWERLTETAHTAKNDMVSDLLSRMKVRNISH
jgi:hypothetical protein